MQVIENTDILSEDEQFFAINNNMIIDDNEEEDKIWREQLNER